MRSRFVLFSSIALCGVALSLAGQANRQAMELRKALGKADEVMGPRESQQDVQNRALQTALARAVEKANGTKVRSLTAVNNNALLLDLVQAYSTGMVEDYKVLTSSWIHEGEALKYSIVVDAQVTPPREIKEDPTFTVLVKVDQDSIFRDGDRLHLTVRSSADAYIHVFDVFADGTVTVLIPNSQHPSRFIKANTDLQFPTAAEEEQGIRLVAGLLPNQRDAQESIVVIATKKDVDLVGREFMEAKLKQIDPRNTGTIKTLARKLFELGDANWVQNVTTYRIIGK